MIVPEPKLVLVNTPAKSKPQVVGDFREVRVDEYFRSMELSANSERAYQRSLSRFLKWTDKGWHLLKHQDLDRYKEYLKESPTLLLWLIFPWLEIFPNSSLLLGLHRLIHTMNQFQPLFLSG